MTHTVRPDSLITLNYRIALADDTELISTFHSAPATLQLGGGELAPTLEKCLEGLPVGERTVFLLEPDQAFGQRHAQLVETFPRTDLPADVELELNAVIEFSGPDGSKFAGLVTALDDASATIDFNHPLAGKAVRFEVEVIGIC